MIKIDYSGIEKKLSKIISSEHPYIGYSLLQKILRNKDIKIDGIRVNSDVVVKSGQEIVIYLKEKDFSPEIVYEDDNIIAYFKPKKILSQGNNSFESKVKEYINPDYTLCHRLDTNTAGVLLFAKNERIYEDIKNVYRDDLVEKHYYAVVYGTINKSGIFTDYLIKNSENSTVKVISDFQEGAKKIITEYKPVFCDGETTLLDITLVTGRTHQIRAHMAYHGYPVIGDGKYGDNKINKRYKTKSQKLISYKIFFKNDERCRYLKGKEIKLDSLKILQHFPYFDI